MTVRTYAAILAIFWITFAALLVLASDGMVIFRIIAALWISGVITFTGVVEIGALTTGQAPD